MLTQHSPTFAGCLNSVQLSTFQKHSRMRNFKFKWSWQRKDYYLIFQVWTLSWSCHTEKMNLRTMKWMIIFSIWKYVKGNLFTLLTYKSVSDRLKKDIFSFDFYLQCIFAEYNSLFHSDLFSVRKPKLFSFNHY